MCLHPHLNEGWGWCCETGLSPPVKYFTDRSKAVLLLWIVYVFTVLCLLCLCVPGRYFFCGSFMFLLSCVCYAFVCSRLWCLTVSLSLSHWYPESGVVLDCIDS